MTDLCQFGTSKKNYIVKRIVEHLNQSWIDKQHIIHRPVFTYGHKLSVKMAGTLRNQ